MSLIDARGLPISGATPAALDAYERAASDFLHWRHGAEHALAVALDRAPGFAMAHVLAAWMQVAGRDPAGVARARPLLAHAAALPLNARERHHVSALVAAIQFDDTELAKSHLRAALRMAPRDALALQVLHSLDYLTGDSAAMHAQVASVLPAWSAQMPGYSAVLAMHAFALGEIGDHARSEANASTALAINPLEVRAHHAMAHVFEMTQRPAVGAAWMRAHAAHWRSGTAVSTHAWWHVALFELARGAVGEALDIYDQHIHVAGTPAIGDLIDASSLLWRIKLHGGSTGGRFRELAGAWAPRIEDAYCSFSDIHAMLAFIGAGESGLSHRLEHSLRRHEHRPTRYGATTRLVGLPASRALLAFGQGHAARASDLLARLPLLAHRLGGSQAQRDVLRLTELKARQRAGERRRPAWNWTRPPVWATAPHS
jgi:hypothetical protein